MNSRNKLGMIGLALLATFTGCDDPSTASKPTTKPTVAIATTAPSQSSPAVLAAFPTRPPSALNLDGRDVLFPAAKLAILGHGTGGYTLRLCSDDPPDAIDPGYLGNSFVLDLRLAIDNVSDIPASSWDYRPSDTDDTNSGIYLHGYKDQYRPSDVHIAFQKDGDELIACVTGNFLHNDNQNPAAPPERVPISGCLRMPMPAGH